MTGTRQRRFLAELAAGLAGIAADETAARLVTAYRVELPDWRNDAACRGVDTGLFYAFDDVSEQTAKALCAGCPVRGECRAHASEQVEYGTWGGMSEQERNRARRRRRVA